MAAIALVSPVSGEAFQRSAPVVHGTSQLLPPTFLAPCHTATGTTSVFCPGNPQIGDAIGVTDLDGAAAANPITVHGNGAMVDGNPTATMTTAFGDAVWVFFGAPGWKRSVPVSRVVPAPTGPVGQPNELASDFTFTMGTDAAAGPPGPPGPAGPAGPAGPSSLVAVTGLGVGGVFDFSVLPNTPINVDGPIVLGGLTWTKRNSALELPLPAQHAKIVNGSGLVLQPGRGAAFTGSDYGGFLGVGDNLAPGLGLPFSQFMPAGVGWPSAVEVAVVVASESQSAALLSASLTVVSIDDGGGVADGGVMYKPGFGAFQMTGTGAANNRQYLSNSRRNVGGNTINVAAPETVTTFAMLAEGLADNYPRTLLTSSAVAAYPSDELMRPEVSAGIGTITTLRGQAPTTTNGLWIFIGAATQTENTLYTVTIKSVRVRYKP